MGQPTSITSKPLTKKWPSFVFSTSTRTLAFAAPTCRNFWQQIARSGTCSQSSTWSLDDALYELTSVRGDLSSLLQPRPRAQKPTQPAAPFKGQGTKGKGNQGRKRTADWESEQPRKKGKGRGGKPSGKPSATQPSKPDDWPENWVTELRGKQLCRRYSRGLCSNPNCKFTAKPTPETVQPLLVWRRRRTVSLSQTLRKRPLPSLVQCLHSLRLAPALRTNSHLKPLSRRASPAVSRVYSSQSHSQMARSRWPTKTASLIQTKR